MPSSVIAAMSYNEETRTLTIVFRGKRGVYRYFDVPPEEFAAFRDAPSKGVYLNEIFKTRQYRYQRIHSH
jgi:KTSC domain